MGSGKVVFFTTSLGSGGAEMHLLRMLNSYPKEFEPPLLLLAKAGGSYEKFLNSGIKVQYLTKSTSSSWSLILSLFRLPKIIKETNCKSLIAIMDIAGITALLSQKLFGVACNVIVSCQVNPNINYEDGMRKWIIKPLIKWLYPSAYKIVAISKGIKKEILKLIHKLKEDQIAVIYNAAVDDSFNEKAYGVSKTIQFDTDRFKLVACGRLTKQKGFENLLKALKIAKNQCNGIQLFIIGEGELKDLLSNKIQEYNLIEDVTLVGFMDNPYRLISESDIFVLSSLWEGFGMVIVEAMALGVPVISTDCKYGPNEIIEHEKNGLLVSVNNPSELAMKICALLKDKDLRDRLALNGLKRSKDFHALEIVNQYLNLI